MPVGVALESVAVASGIVKIVGRIVNKRLGKKAEKHDRIRQTADTTLRTQSDIVSKALRDGEINETEYVQVVDEMDRYNEIKEEIRKETRKALTNIDTMLANARKEGKEEGVKLEHFKKTESGKSRGWKLQCILSFDNDPPPAYGTCSPNLG